MRFNKDMIRLQSTADGKKEVPLVEFTQQKTQKIMSIPLSKRVKEILKLRNGDFPRKISSVKYNVYIKEVCKLAGIELEIFGSRIDTKTNRKKPGFYPKCDLITSHIGRRSFATNNYGKIPTPLLMSATGHTTEKMFLQYIGKTETDRAMQLAEYFA
jgi:integrase